MSISVGRETEYLEDEIEGVPCARCGASSQQQFNVCALDGRFVALCPNCDIVLNAIVVRDFLELDDADELVAAYRAKMLGTA